MSKNKSIMYVLIAAILFGCSAPISKLFLGKIEPIPMAAFLYIGSGVGLSIYKIIHYVLKKSNTSEAPLIKKDVPWLIIAIIFGGVIAPIILMTSLKVTPASTTSLLLNFEGVATTLIAVTLFKESADKKVWMAIIIITLSSIILSWDFTGKWGFSMGSLGIITACFCWGIDNNFTGKISAKDPVTIVIIKGISAGLFSLIIALVLKNPIPNIKIILGVMFLGCFSYGFSIVLFVLALRNLGSARTSTLFSTAPFIGTILSFIIFKDKINNTFIIAVPIMILGTILLLNEKHNHKHLHKAITHEHSHCHNDGHHNHKHQNLDIGKEEYHSHMHVHETMIHEHEHTPDIQHKHIHD